MGYPALMALQAQAFHKPLKGPGWNFLGGFSGGPMELQWLSVLHGFYMVLYNGL